jgi:hypothetical protein
MQWFSNMARSATFGATCGSSMQRPIMGISWPSMITRRAARYNQLNDDIRNDVVRIPPFFDIARRVIETDRKRQATMDILTDISPPERFNALARIAENNLTIAWVEASLSQRCAGYRFALNRLVVSEPEGFAANVDISLALLQQQIAANQVVPATQFAAAPVGVAAQPPPIVK